MYTDGVTEAMDSQRQLFGAERLEKSLERGRALTLADSIALILRDLEEWSGGLPAQDDISILAVEVGKA